MINVSINGISRPDVRVETGGTLEQTSEHATSSSLALRVPIASDNFQDCDYIQIFDGDNIVFAGTVLKYTQRTFVTPLDFRIYDLEITGTSDYIASVYVDLGFPAGASISQILFGNSPNTTWYSATMPQFPGIFSERIQPEGITLGTVDDFSTYILSESAYLWGQTVKSLLDNLCEVSGAWWEITPDKVFNMRYEYNLSQCPYSLTPDSNVFNVSVSKDALTFYSACRVIGGVGESALNSSVTVYAQQPTGLSANAQYIWQSNLTTLETNPQILKASQILQTINGNPSTSSTSPGTINIGFKGINDDDPQYQALMSYEGTTIELKDGYEFLDLSNSANKIVVTNVVYQVPIYARVVDSGLCKIISEKRGGTGVVEYNIEDDTITTFNNAISAATNFLNNFAQRSVEISFSTFFPCSVGQKITVRLPYYKIDDSYTITQVTQSFVLDKATENAIIQYTVTASNIKYRDPYKALFYTAPKITFSLDSTESPADGIYADNTIQVKTIIGIYSYQPNTWQIIQQRTSSWSEFQNYYTSWIVLETSTTPYSWSNIQQQYKSWTAFQKNVLSWASLQSLNEEVYNIGNYLTDEGRALIIEALSGSGNIDANFYQDITLVCDTGNVVLAPTESTATTDGAISSYYIAPNEINSIITGISITQNNTASGTPYLLVPVNIDHTGTSTGGQYALTISIQTKVQ